MKKKAIVAVIVVVALLLVPSTVAADDGNKCTCGGVNKVEIWEAGWKIYLNHEFMIWAHWLQLGGGLSAVMASITALFTTLPMGGIVPAFEVVLLIGLYLISGGSFMYMAQMATQGIIIWHSWYLPVPFRVEAQAPCSYPHGGGGSGGIPVCPTEIVAAAE